MNPALFLLLAQATLPANTFPALDTDRDGSVSRLEASANPELSREFRQLDANQDGALEPAEFARFEKPAPPPGGTPPPALPPDTSAPPAQSVPPKP